MSPRSSIILVDTMVIIEAHRTHTWAALSKTLQLETVEACALETQTGAQNRRPEQLIDEIALRASLRQIHSVSELDRAKLLLRDAQAAVLDPGERDLWAHALQRPDTWLFCGPDRASYRLAIRLGFRDRLLSLEALCREAGSRPAPPLASHHTRKGHEAMITAMAIQEGRWP